MTQSIELKQVRNALSSAIKRLETIKETFPAISVDSDIKIYRDAIATLDRLSAPVGVPEGYKLIDMVRPVTSEMKAICIGEFSFFTEEPEFNEDGEYTGETYSKEHVVPWDVCKDIYKAMLSAAPTPAPTAVDLDGLKREIFVKLYPNSSYMPEMNHLVSLDNAINFLAAKYDFVRKV